MRILGVSDGLDAGAALAIDDRLVASEQQGSFDAAPRSRAFPWDAIADVLRRTRTPAERIDTIAVAGRFSPPFFLRRRPGLRRIARSPFSTALDVGIFYQAMLRQTGIGALEASRVADWLRDRFAERGFRARVVMVDVHTALANAAYRTQPRDRALIVTLHPMGDGVSLAVHQAAGGQIDRVFEQRGFSSLHVHLWRCAAAIGCPDPRAMWTLGGAAPDEALLADLHRSLHAEGGRLSRRAYPFPEDPATYERLRRVPQEVAAASVHENLRAAVSDVIAHHLSAWRAQHLIVAGEVFEDARLVADLAGLPGVRSVSCPAEPGSGALAIGAAAYVAGTSPGWFDPTGDDPEIEALSGSPLELDQVTDLLVRGERVAWSSGRSGPWSFRTAERCVLRLPVSHAESPARGARALAFDRPAAREGASADVVLAPALRVGAAEIVVDEGFAERSPSVVSPDRRARVVPVADDAQVHGVLARLADRDAGTCLEARLLPGLPARADALRTAARDAGCALWVAGGRQASL